MSDIQELFSRDPLKYSMLDIDAIIAYYRTQRVNFVHGVKKSTAEPAPKLPVKKLSLSDLLGKKNDGN